jgi:PLP dependent protein
VQDALPKMNALSDLPITWHFIGHLQSNKARDVAERFDWVHGVDRIKLATALGRARPAARGPLDVCVQVNISGDISGEATKGGVAPGEAASLVDQVCGVANLRVRGFMGMASPTRDDARQRAEFATLRKLLESSRARGCELDTLSMGMSTDLEAAIAEGATMVRVGTAIFGARQ